MIPLPRLVHQQDLAPIFGEAVARRACLPTCFYLAARLAGYLPALDFIDYYHSLQSSSSYQPGRGWIRPALSRELRQRYHIPIVSWRLSAEPPLTPADRQRMIAAGYLSSQRELHWYQQQVLGRPLEAILAVGQPVIVTMKPGFGYNQSVHAVVLTAVTATEVTILDPDRRNPKTRYRLTQLRRLMSPEGAGSMILP